MNIQQELQLELEKLQNKCMQDFESKKNELISKYTIQTKEIAFSEQVAKERQEQSYIDEKNKSVNICLSNISYAKNRLIQLTKEIESNQFTIDNIETNLKTPTEKLAEILNAKNSKGTFKYIVENGKLYRSNGYQNFEISYISPRKEDNTVLDYFGGMEVINHINNFRK